MSQNYLAKINFGPWVPFNGNLKDIKDLSYKDEVKIRLKCPHENVITDYLSDDNFCSDCGTLIKDK